MHLLVDALERSGKLGSDAVCSVEFDALGERGVSDQVAVGKVLGKDRRAGFGFLRDLAIGTDVGVRREVVTGDLLDRMRGFDFER